MAKPSAAAVVLASALCFLSLFAIAHSASADFYVQGEVYCDTCRSQFVNKLSEPMPNAKVRLVCRGNDDETNVTLTVEGETDASGVYRLPVSGDHEDEVCEIQLVKSSKPGCGDIPTEKFTKDASRVILTKNSGMIENTRHANPLGFMNSKAPPECMQIYKDLDMLPDTE